LTTESGAFAKWSGTSYYETLGVASNATDQQIQRAYRRIALLTHPDRSGTTDRIEEFRAATKAYEVLSQERAEYDEYRRGLREWEAAQRARERAEADRAARARRHEAERRLRQQPRRPAPSTGTSDAPLYAVYDGRSWRSRNNALQAMLDEQMRQLAAMPGSDVEVTVVGQRTFYRDGFLIRSPDGGWVEVEPRLLPGRYLIAEERGEFARFGGPRGNLLLNYYWPRQPLPGADFETSVKVPASKFRRARTFVNPVDGSLLRIPPRTAGSVLQYEMRGFRGEFGGLAGDLWVHVELEGSRTRPGLMLLLALIAAIVVAILVYLPS